MQQLLLLSIIFGTILIPVDCAKHQNPFIGLKLMITRMILFIFFYVAALIFIYPRLF